MLCEIYRSFEGTVNTVRLRMTNKLRRTLFLNTDPSRAPLMLSVSGWQTS